VSLRTVISGTNTTRVRQEILCACEPSHQGEYFIQHVGKHPLSKAKLDILDRMKRRLFSTKTAIIVLMLLAALSVAVYFLNSNNSTPNWVTTTVERGDVQDIVSVSGFVEAKNTAQLSFPVTGIVTDIFTKEGATVLEGELLATLGSNKLVAQRAEMVAALQKAQAARDELVTGPTDEARGVTQTTVSSAEASFENTVATEAKKVANAKAALLSNNLEARSTESSESATAPTIAGSYLCEEEGLYTVSIYKSGANSGFSYNLTGIETDSDSVFTEQPAPLGNCGLTIQFTEGDRYADSEWIIELPNTKSATYVTYKNAYDLALQQQEQNVQTARDSFALATDNATLSNAAPSSASLRQANASVYSAQARVTQIDEQIKDLSIIAPFDGIITEVDIRLGETAGVAPVMTLLAQDAFELKARIPEIDITKISTEQRATIIFDAQSEDTLTGILTFVSPLATEIDGVAYFETTIALDAVPQWIRSGLNADVDIIVNELADALRVPKRYLIENDDRTFSVLVRNQNDSVPTPVEVLSTGNNGYSAITGLTEGDVIIAP